MVVHVNIYGHMQLELLSMQVTCLIDVPVLHHQEVLLHLLLALTTTVNLEQKIAMINLYTTCLTHYRMEVGVLQAITVVPISTYHGSNIS